MERARPSPGALPEPLDPTRPASVSPWCLQFLEPISCTFDLGQCELAFLSIESEGTLVPAITVSSGVQLWKRGDH